MHTAVVDHKAAWMLKGNGGQQINGLILFSLWLESISYLIFSFIKFLVLIVTEKCDSVTPVEKASATRVIADVQSDMKTAVKVNSPPPEDFLGFPTQEEIKSSGNGTCYL